MVMVSKREPHLTMHSERCGVGASVQVKESFDRTENLGGLFITPKKTSSPARLKQSRRTRREVLRTTHVYTGAQCTRRPPMQMQLSRCRPESLCPIIRNTASTTSGSLTIQVWRLASLAALAREVPRGARKRDLLGRPDQTYWPWH